MNAKLWGPIKESHPSREWSNTIGYKMGSSSTTRVYTTTKVSRWRASSMDVKIWHGCQHGNTFLLGEFYGGQVSWTTSNPRTIKLAFGELQLEAFFFLVFLFLHLVQYTIPTVASNSVVLGWNPWPTGALLHKSPASKPALCLLHKLEKKPRSICGATCCVMEPQHKTYDSKVGHEWFFLWDIPGFHCHTKGVAKQHMSSSESIIMALPHCPLT